MVVHLYRLGHLLESSRHQLDLVKVTGLQALQDKET